MSLASLVVLSKLLDFSMSWFSALKNGNINFYSLVGSMLGLNEIACRNLQHTVRLPYCNLYTSVFSIVV